MEKEAEAPPPSLVDSAIKLAQYFNASNRTPADRVIATVNATVCFEWYTPEGFLAIEVIIPQKPKGDGLNKVLIVPILIGSLCGMQSQVSMISSSPDGAAMKDESDVITIDEWLLRRIHYDRFGPPLSPGAFEPRIKGRNPDTTGISFFRQSCINDPVVILAVVNPGKRAEKGIVRISISLLIQMGLSVVIRPIPEVRGHVEIPEINSTDYKTKKTSQIWPMLVKIAELQATPRILSDNRQYQICNLPFISFFLRYFVSKRIIAFPTAVRLNEIRPPPVSATATVPSARAGRHPRAID